MVLKSIKVLNFILDYRVFMKVFELFCCRIDLIVSYILLRIENWFLIMFFF